MYLVGWLKLDKEKKKWGKRQIKKENEVCVSVWGGGGGGN